MKDWEKTLVLPSDSIKSVLKTIDASSAQIAVVVGKRRKLLGTVTDGDVRRGILRGVSLDDNVQLVLNPKPIYAKMGQTGESLLKRMEKHFIHQIPVLDAGGSVVGLEILDDLIQSKSRENWVLLMAGGLGSRLKPLTNDRPKPLIHIGDKPILATILENFVGFGFKKFYLAVNYLDEMIRDYFGDGSKWGVELKYLKESRRLGTAGALSLLPQKPREPLIVMNGDLLTKVNFSHLLNFHHENNVSATMCVREYDFQVPFGVITMDQQYIRAIDEKPVHRFFVNAGIYVLEPSLLKYVPQNKPYDMPQLFDRLIDERKRVAAFPIREYWLDIGQMEDFNRANGEYQKFFG
ncbi:MAG: nucleotidyltransferase family protein [Candidatus Omnitrophota bacterium]